MPTKSATPNRLAQESSPYLLQHANNPVDWYPWGEEALAKSRSEDKPIFLSIGYSACHWCHVMEHESFEDEGIARLLNENFVSVKVDREERPDLDQIYMNAVMALRGGGGGWPLSVFLTPNQEVFFGGTYWPPTSRMGMPGFDHVLRSVLEAFTTRRDQVEEQSQKITAWLTEPDSKGTELALNRDLLITAVKTIARHFDYENGGIGGAPKFPHAMDLRLLILLSRSWPEHLDLDRDGLLEMVRISCKKMAHGGIYDHLGGGFARYSVDEKWLVPHFEKMLYDNALLADVYLEMFQATGDDFYRSVATETLDYVLNYLTDELGPFYCTEDADSEGEEGKFYVWSKQEIKRALGSETGDTFCELYGVTESGNFEGHNILNLTISIPEFANRTGIELSKLRQTILAARGKLLEIREQRVRPGLDDKVLVSWNGLAIHALARAGVILSEQKYGNAAAKAAEFILRELRNKNGRLLHTWRQGVAKLAAYLDDYANLIAALVELYQFDYNETWIDHAVELMEQMVEHFADPSNGGCYFTADDHEQLIARTKSFQDSSVPSGNAMAAIALLRLGRLTGKTEWVERAEKTISAAMPLMARSPLASGQMLIALEQLLDDAKEIVLVAESRTEISECLTAIRSRWDPASLVLVRCSDDTYFSREIDEVLKGKTPINGEPTMYICNGFVCQKPILGTKAILSSLVVEQQPFDQP